MNWEAIGAVGEIIGALAVVVSVVYLATQVKKQTTESRLAATRELGNSYSEALGPTFEDKEFSSLYLKAIQNYENLPREDRFRVAMYIQRCFRMFEQHFVHTREQKVDKIFIDSINLSFEEWLTFPGIQSYWKLSSDLFVPEFRMHVDDLVEKVEERGYHSSFKQ